ncbi:MAG: hypothetical protein M3Y67_08450 [Pseudomonadota bacterium]|nr:hypothetical protein [Pseudomonadota bacterium]
MAADWDADSPQLQRNLAEVLASVRDDARRFPPRVSEAKRWQKMTMADLAVPDPVYVGSFRGESGLEDVWVSIGGVTAIPPGEVKGALR